jgi:3-dehydroquinate synthase
VSDPETTIHVRLSERSYDIVIGTGNLDRLGEFLSTRTHTSHAIVVTDRNVETPHAQRVCRSLEDSGKRTELLVLEPGEGTKSVTQADALWREFLHRKADRKSVVVAVGGGVVGDLAGFVAATYARGLDFVQVPTTLLAQVDSSVGGKVAINLPNAKNMVGAFWQPRGVLIDTRVLETLPLREYRAGLGEVVKYGVILDEEFFGYLEDHIEAINDRAPQVLRHILARSCRLKADVVQADEREESGLRSVLNYGHTFCHAIEALTGYGTYLHGEAVAVGMLCASRLAERLGRIDASVTQRQHDLLVALGLPVAFPDLDADEFLAAMQRDKKVAHGRLRFVLPTRMGHVELVGDVPAEHVRVAIQG